MVADAKMVEYHGQPQVESYVLTIMNMVRLGGGGRGLGGWELADGGGRGLGGWWTAGAGGWGEAWGCGLGGSSRWACCVQ